jgi:hypothetical protein
MSLPTDKPTRAATAPATTAPTEGRPRRRPPPTHESVDTIAEPPAKGLAGLVRGLKKAWSSDLQGRHREELRQAQRDVILSRTVVLIWISIFVMPTAIWTFVYFAARPVFTQAVWIVLAAIAAVLLLRVALARGAFRTHYHLAMLVLVGGVFGPTGSAIMAISRASGGNFLFAYFLIYFAFTALFPADAVWIVVTSLAIVTSYVVSAFVGLTGAATHDPQLVNNLIYFMELTFIGVVLNRVLCKLFFDERRARIDLRGARDALFAEMEVAQDIQTLLLPGEPTLPGFALHGLMTPAAEVGGDYYDVIETEGGRRLVAVGDVSGHGVTTGLTMMMVRASLVGTLEAKPDAPLPEIYAAMNRSLRRNLERMNLRLYMTFALLEHMGGGKFRAVGGHLPGLVYRSQKKSIEEIEFAGIWLGVLDKVTPEMVPETTFELGRGDTLLLLTDGVVERNASQASGGDGMFGFERVHELLAANADRGPAFVIDKLMTSLAEFGKEQDDDVTVVALQYVGAREAGQAS